MGESVKLTTVEIPNDYKLVESEHFSISHSVGYRVAGFLFVVPKRQVRTLAEMTTSELSLLGPSLSIACEAVQAVIQPSNIYCAKFGESDGTVHFHIFPRTEDLTRMFFEEVEAANSIDAPRLMSWANNRFLGNREFGDIAGTIDLFRAHFSQMQ